MTTTDLTLLLAAVKAAAVLAMGGLAALALWRATAAARHLVWVLAVAVAVLVPAAAAVTPAWPVAVLPPPPRPAPAVAAPGVTPPVDVAGPERLTPPKVIDSPPPVRVDRPARVRRTVAWPAVALGVWAAGTAVLAMACAIGHLAAWRLARSATVVAIGAVADAADAVRRDLRVRRAVVVRVGGRVVTPVVTGLWRPAVLLPADVDRWPADSLRATLVHELSHVRRGDGWTQLLGHACCAMYWFNPLAWVAAARLRVERERACDDAVLRHGADPAVYAELLLAVAAAVRGAGFAGPAAVGMARRSGLGTRVRQVLSPTADRRPAGRRWTVAVTAVAVALLGSAAAVRLMPRPARAQAVPPPATTRAADTLDVRVVDPAGRPIAGAAVSTMWAAGDRTAETDPAGHATVPRPAGTPFFNVHVSRPGFASKSVRWDGPAPVAAYTVQMAPGVRIGGRVVDGHGRPVGGAHVELLVDQPIAGTPERYAAGPSLTTAADGTWAFADGPPLEGGIEVAAWDYRHATDGNLDFHSPQTDALRDETATVVLDDGRPVTGVVTGPDGKPLAGAEVSAGAQVSSFRLPPEVTGADGRFAYAVGRDRDLVLTVSATGFAPDLRQVTAGGGPAHFDVRLAPSRPAVGTVLDPDGRPVADAGVFPDTWRGNRSLQVRLATDAAGRFAWADAPADDVLCDVDATDQGFLRKRSVAVRGGGPAVVVRLTRSPRVTGTVVDGRTGRPIDRFQYLRGEAHQAGHPIWYDRQSGMRDGRGGRFTLTEDAEALSYGVRVEADGYLPAESRPFTVDAGEVPLRFALVAATGPTLTVLRPDQWPAAGATGLMAVGRGHSVRLRNGAEPENFDGPRATADADGRMAFPPQAGDWRVAVIGPDGFASVDADDLARAGGRVTLSPWARVEGTARVGGKPAAGETVSIEPATPVDWEGPAVSAEYQATTDAAGRFAFERVPPGPVKVARRVVRRIARRGSMWTPVQERSVDAPAGRTVAVDLGGGGRSAVGRAVVPAAVSADPNWRFGSESVVTRTDPGAGEPDVYPLEFGPDGTFHVEGLPAGSYRLSAEVTRDDDRQPYEAGPTVARGSAAFVVPPPAAGRAEPPLELPPVVMTATAGAPQPGPGRSRP